MVKIAQDIFYRPNLQIPESYHTDGTPPHLNQNTQTAVRTQTRTLTFLKDECSTVLKSLVTLPVPIKKPLQTGLFTVQFLLTLIPESTYEDIDSPEHQDQIHVIEYEPHENQTIENNAYENALSNIFGAQKIEYLTKTNTERINYKYYASLCNIIEDYINKVKKVLTAYNTSILSQIGINNLDLLERRYISNHDQIVEMLGPDYGNISDMLVRSQATKSQKLRLLSKLCNERLSLTHIKSCELSRLLLARYYEQEKNNNYFHDAVLMQQIKSEEIKLDKKIEQLYKYLNTSVILAKECLTLYANEGIAKKYLQDRKEEVEKASDSDKTFAAIFSTPVTEEEDISDVESTEKENTSDTESDEDEDENYDEEDEEDEEDEDDEDDEEDEDNEEDE